MNKIFINLPIYFLTMRLNLLLILFFISCSVMLGQPERSKKSGMLRLDNYDVPTKIETPKVEAPKPKLGYKSIFDTNEDDYLKKFTFKKEEKVAPIMVEKTKGYDFDEDRKNALNEKLKEGSSGNQSTQYLGEFSVKSNLVKVMCRDHQEPDGDVVSILVNNVVVVPSVYLESGYKTFYLTLKEGNNYIDFVALNQGASGPNTAAFVVFDEFGSKVTSSQWNLNTGVKASLVLINKAETTELTNEPKKEVKEE